MCDARVLDVHGWVKRVPSSRLCALRPAGVRARNLGPASPESVRRRGIQKRARPRLFTVRAKPGPPPERGCVLGLLRFSGDPPLVRARRHRRLNRGAVHRFQLV